MTLPYWADNDQANASAWNQVTLGPVTLPGICTVNVIKEREVDVNKAKGVDGPTMKDTGAGQGQVIIDMTLANREQWEAWQRIRPKIDPNRPGGAKSPLQIQHPLTTLAGISAVYIVSIEEDAPTAKHGLPVRIRAPEWVAAPKPSKPKTTTVPAAKVRQNSFVSSVAGETAAGQRFVEDLQSDVATQMARQNF